MKRRGITLIELMVAAVMTIFITLALTETYSNAINYENQSSAARETENARIRFEDRLTSLFRLARVTSDTTDRFSYFIGQQGNNIPVQQTNGTGGTTSSSGSNAGGGGSQGNNYNTSDTVVFTTYGLRVPGQVLTSQDDFETQNSNFGPQGGAMEVELSTTSVGDSNGKSGLFIRTERPADGDPSQGGVESVLDSEVTEIGFEFFDGVEWSPTWNSQSGTRRLPGAVRVTYRITGDDEDRIFIIRMPLSDVTPDNPVATGATG